MIYRKEVNYLAKVRNNLSNKINGANVLVCNENMKKINIARNKISEAIEILEAIQ